MRSEYPTKPRELGGIPLTDSMAKIIEFLTFCSEEYHPKTIAKRTRMKYSTTRRHCYTLWKKGLLSRNKVDGLTFYFLAPQIRETIQPIKDIRYHGFKIKCRSPWKYNINRDGIWREELFLIHDGTGNITFGDHQVGKMEGAECVGEVSFQHMGGTLMVSYGGAGRQLSLGEYEAFCGWLGGRFGCDIMREWPDWGLSQVGIGVDELSVHFDRFGEAGSKGSVSIADFHGNVYRHYDKTLDNGRKVRRTHDIHLNASTNVAPMNILVESTISNLFGSLPANAHVNLTAQTNARIDTLTRTVDGLTSTLQQFTGMVMELIKVKGGGG